MNRPVITLLTDFGTADHYVAAMKGVILGICPDAQLIDISHEVAPYAISEAAYTLSQAWTYFPEGAVHLVVVDPGVGSSRRGLCVRAAGHRFVAPDNGVLSMVYEAVPDHEALEITASRYFRQPVSRTFHGRDIFGPVAAHLATGVPDSAIGEPIHDALRCGFAKPAHTGHRTWVGAVLKVDRFGNVITNFDSAIWSRLTLEPFELTVGDKVVTRLAANYMEMNQEEPCAIGGSAGFLEISLNRASAAKITGVRSGDSLTLKLT